MSSTSCRTPAFLRSGAETSVSGGDGVSRAFASRPRYGGRRAGVRVCNTLSMDPPSSQAASAESKLAQKKPLIRGGRAVEEEALVSALRTAEDKNTLDGRRIQFAGLSGDVLEAAYRRCGEVTEDYGRTFYLATQLMNEQRRKAIWAIYVWCRRTDELVDGPNASYITPKALDEWTSRLESVFGGRPYDLLDAALNDTVSTFPVDIQPFYDMIDGMRMDLIKPRYETFDELYEYCYRVAGTVALMSVPIMGLCPKYKGSPDSVYRAALALGSANQLTNILRDVGEDIRTRSRIYLPLEDLRRFNIEEHEVINCTLVSESGVVDPRWKEMMKFQIERARQYFRDAEAGIAGLEQAARWPVWSALIVYSKILDAIEKNDYDNFNKRAFVTKKDKLIMLPIAYAKANFSQ